ncbi:unnamed protein product [Musa textilis]
MFKLLLWKEILSHGLFMSKKMGYPCAYHMIFLTADWAATFGTAMTSSGDGPFTIRGPVSFKISQLRVGSSPAAPDSVPNGVDVGVPPRPGHRVVRVAKLK